MPKRKLTEEQILGVIKQLEAGRTAGDMASGAVTPDFQRTINVYDSQGGSQPVTFSFAKTGANTWAYEASYAGTAANVSTTGPLASGTMTFNSDGSLANADNQSCRLASTMIWR